MDEPVHHAGRCLCPTRPHPGLILVAMAIGSVPAATSAALTTQADPPPGAYEFVARAVLSLLPSPLGEDLQAHVRTFERAAVDGPRANAPDGNKGDDAQRHYIMLDVAAGKRDWRARHAAACEFPRDRDRAGGLFRHNGERLGGSLPWTFGDRLGSLSRALKAGTATDVAREAGIVVHLAVDAAWPFNTTTARAGFGTDDPLASPTNAAAPTREHRGLQERLRFGLGRLLRERSAGQVPVPPNRLAPPDQPLDAVFEMLLDSHALLEPLAAIDGQILQELGVEGPMSFRTQDAYYARLAVRAGPILQSRLQAAARLAANLIGEAWRRAHEASSTEPAAARMADGTQADPGGENPPGYVGSRNSQVFHRPTCTHATRIRLANQVRFPTVEDALQAGRTPCKSCKPDQQNGPGAP